MENPKIPYRDPLLITLIFIFFLPSVLSFRFGFFLIPLFSSAPQSELRGRFITTLKQSFIQVVNLWSKPRPFLLSVLPVAVDICLLSGVFIHFWCSCLQTAKGYILLFDVLGGGDGKSLYEPVYPRWGTHTDTRAHTRKLKWAVAIRLLLLLLLPLWPGFAWGLNLTFVFLSC